MVTSESTRATNESVLYIPKEAAKTQNDDKFKSILGRTILNHQKYEILFKERSFTIFCDLKRDGISYSDIPLEVARDSVEPNINSPYSYTFDTQTKRLVLGRYGLTAGMENADKDHKDGVEKNNDEKEKKEKNINSNLKIADKFLGIVIKVVALIIILRGGGGAGAEFAKKLFGLN